IRPTSINRTPESIKNFLNEDQFKLYDLIWRRTVASQMAESENKKTTVITSSENDKYKFLSEYDELVFEGFRKLFPQKETDKIPNINEKDTVNLESVIKEQKFTQHTPRYSEASLIKTMEELGVGRPSTYASILNTIKEKKYIWVINRSIYISPVGNALVEELKKYFSDSVMDYKFTEKMENDLDQISNGNLDRNDFVKSFWNNFEPIKNNYEKIADENPRNPSEYNFLRTNIICSSDTPCINSETGKEFEENDPPLGDKSLNDNLEKQTRMIWIRFRNKNGDGGFLACEDKACKVTADESAWAGFGRRRTRTLEALKKAMKEKCIH
ncbi:MAG: DNA topoisomerase, partial [Chloroflexota bacterium]|nr:DNA topoisomerase [Chloroflexota bacterium]